MKSYHMTNPNKNCLKGMRCPECGSYGPFLIEAKVTILIYDDGTEDDGTDTEWEDDSYCHCPECNHAGDVKEFTEETSP